MIYFKNVISNILVLIFGYFGMIILKFLDSSFSWQEFHSNMYLGIVVITMGIVIRVWASVEFAKHKIEVLEMNRHRLLVTSGPYRYSRNPLYVGILLIAFGFILLAGSIAGFLFLLLFFIFWNLVITLKEEPDLKRIFGKDFEDYKINVRRWL